MLSANSRLTAAGRPPTSTFSILPRPSRLPCRGTYAAAPAGNCSFFEGGHNRGSRQAFKAAAVEEAVELQQAEDQMQENALSDLLRVSVATEGEVVLLGGSLDQFPLVPPTASANLITQQPAPALLESQFETAIPGSTLQQLTWKAIAAEADTSMSASAAADAGNLGSEMGTLRFGGSLQGMLLLNLSALLFGSNQVVIKMTEEAMDPSVLSAIRFGIAALCFAPAIARGLRKRELRAAALELGLWLFGGYTAQAVGLMQTTAARGAFTGTFTVVAVPLLVGLSGRRVPWTTWTAAVVAMAGVGLLTSSGADPNMGDALCILSATLFGVHKWRSESVTARFEETSELIAVQLVVLAAASAVLCMPGLVHTWQDTSPAELLATAQSLPWVSIVYMGLATTAFTLWTEMNALKTVSAPMAALIYTAEPLWGALFAWGLLGERWGPSGWAGAALIVGASLASQLVGEDKEKVA